MSDDDRGGAEPFDKSETMPIGVVVRASPGVTRWAPTAWRAAAVLPGAGAAIGAELRREETDRGAIVERHVATLPLELHRAETEGYRVALANEPPLVWVVMRPGEDPARDAPEPFLVTASPYEAQDYADSGEELVEALTAPDAVIAWMRDFCAQWHVDTPFVKRRRDKAKVRGDELGVGDRRIRQARDVYRAPGDLKAAAPGAETSDEGEA